MFKNKALILFSLIIAAAAVTGFGQVNADVGIKATFAGGDVTAISDGKIALTTVDGPIEVIIVSASVFKKVTAENLSLKGAVASSVSEIAVGDKLLVSGLVAEDKKSITAKTVYLMSKSTIAERNSKELEDWRNRGTTGRVASVDPMTNAITVTVGSGMMAREVAVKPDQATEFMRFSPDSNDFAKAKKSSIAEIEKGDEIRVLGNRNADGSEIAAEKVVTGSFSQTGGTIKSIDIEKGQITIQEVWSKKVVTISVLPVSVLKQFPAEMATRLAMFNAMQQSGFRPPDGQQNPQNAQQNPQNAQQNPRNAQQNPQQNPEQRTPGQMPGGGMGQGGARRGGVDDSQFPVLKITDFKVGDMIAVLSSKSTDPAAVRAIKIYNGIKPFIDAQEAMAARSGGQRGGGGANSSFTIPGLDGFGN